MIEGNSRGLTRRELLLSGTAFVAKLALPKEGTGHNLGILGIDVTDEIASESLPPKVYTSLNMKNDLAQIISALNPRIIANTAGYQRVLRRVATMPLGEKNHLEVNVAVAPQAEYQDYNFLRVLNADEDPIVDYKFYNDYTTIDIHERDILVAGGPKDVSKYMKFFLAAIHEEGGDALWKDDLAPEIDEVHTSLDAFMSSLPELDETKLLPAHPSQLPQGPVYYFPTLKQLLNHGYGELPYVNTDFFEGIGSGLEIPVFQLTSRDVLPEPEYQI